MLVSLHVKNLALIEECEIFLGKGLNILTGETGAGKSVIIGSIRYALGEKAGKECIRTGADYALVELLFSTTKQEVLDKMQELDLPMEDEDTILIQRKILPGRSVCKVNGETIGSRQLRDLASLLLDIHGQNDTQTLLNSKNYIDILDDYASGEILSKKRALKEAYLAYHSLQVELDDALLTDTLKDKELSLAEFEIQEIEEARLIAGEDEELEVRYRKMNNSKKIAEAMSRAYQATDGEGDSASAMVSYALREISSVASYDKEVEGLEEQLSSIEELLSDFNRSSQNYLESLDYSQEEYLIVENRLNTYNHLKSKYGNTVDDILKYQQTQLEKLEKLKDFNGYLDKLRMQMNTAKENALKAAKVVSDIRKEQGNILAKELEEALLELNFSDVSFEVCVDRNEDKLSANGYDDVSFMISLNAGEPKKALNLVASGGELSRIMLALKTIMADKDHTQTLIFDEIDSGISGKTAWQVSQKMAVLGKEHQLICITHLPQIAAMADTHFLIEKTQNGSKVITQIRELLDEESVLEVARLLGSDSVTDAVLANAKDLKKQALKTKNDNQI